MGFMLALFPVIVLLSLSQNTRPAAVQTLVPQKLVSACAAVTRTDVEEALGRYVDKGTEQSDSLQSTCDYAGKNGVVTVQIHRLSAELNIPSEIEQLKAALPGATVRETEGMGSHAFFLDIPNAGTQLHVIRGSEYYVLVSVLGFGDAAKVTGAVESIGRKVLARL